MTPHECILCEKKKSEWSSKPGTNKNPENEDLRKTYSELIARRLWPIDEDMFILPLLHLLLGTANYQILKRLIPFLLTLEPSSREVDLKKELFRLVIDVDKFTCVDVDIEILKGKAEVKKTRYNL